MPARRAADVVEIDISAVGPDGDGKGWLGRTRITVPFTIPGERVRVRAGRARDGEVAGDLLDVLTPSADRVVARCRHFGPASAAPCGGCTWQHIAYPRQLALKRGLVRDALRRVLRDPPDVRSTIGLGTDAPWGFRQKVHFTLAPSARRRGHVMGHYARGTRDVVPVRECPVHAAPGNAAAFRVADAAASAGADLGLRGLLARVSHATGRVMVTLVSDGPPGRALRALTRRALLSDPAVVSVSVSVHSGRGSLILGDETRLVAGEPRLTEVIDGTTYLVSPSAFFQTSCAAATRLVSEVLAQVPPDLPVLDLYCGGGLFALPIARRGQPVVGIEANRLAIADAVASRHANRIPASRCRFIAAPVEAALRRVSSGEARVVIMDPPRAGASERVLDDVLRQLRPRVLVYVSCDLESLARDLGHIERGGYRVSRVQPIDMFPHTADVETVAVAEPSVESGRD
ncbi:MAG: 23S rRNA (uracil(1939)-C(5))-methyltransferase RlmD [Vicinamibacterales bacterium]